MALGFPTSLGDKPRSTGDPRPACDQRKHSPRSVLAFAGNHPELDSSMPPILTFPIRDIYVPAKRAKTLDPDKVQALAEDILENGQKVPIRLREGKGRYVLQEGLHRLEALRALGEDSIQGYLARARLH
jgi:uncharacterized ParB-like nuclease family protein